MKRLLALITIALLISFLFPITVFAFTPPITVSDGQTLNLTTGELTLTSDSSLITTYTIATGDTISVAANATDTITGSKNVIISCDSGVTLTIQDVTIDTSSIFASCALAFTGSGNKLLLDGVNSFSSYQNQPGIKVETGTALTIDNAPLTTGSLTALGGLNAAGIGGGYQNNNNIRWHDNNCPRWQYGSRYWRRC